MKNKKTSIILGVSFLLCSCLISTSDEQQESSEKKESKSLRSYEYTLHSDIISSNFDKELLSKYKIVRQLVLKEDYNKAFSLATKSSDDKLCSASWFELKDLVKETKAIKTNDSNYEAYNNRGKNRYEFNDKVGALKDINNSLKINPYYSKAYLNRAYIEKDSKEYEKAKKDYDLAIKYNPYSTHILGEKGEFLYNIHSYNEALDVYTEVIKLESSPYYMMCRGLTYYQLGDKENSLKDAKQAEKLFKKNNDERYKLAQKLQNVDALQADTIKEIEKELSLLKEDGKYTALSANDNLPEYDDIEDAKKYYDMLFNSNTKNKNIDNYQKAYKNLINGNYDKVKKVFNCKITGKGTEDATEEICSYYSLYAGSVELWSKIIKESSEPSIWYNLGSAKSHLYDKKGAIKAFNKAIELRPSYSEAYFHRALIEKDNDDYEKAAKDIDLATQYDPYNAELYFRASQLYMDLYLKQKEKQNINPNTRDETIKNINNAINITPQNKYLITRALYNLSLYNDWEEKRIKQTKEDIVTAKKKAEKNNNKTDIMITTSLLEEITKIENHYVNSLVNMSIYRQAYYSINVVKDYCGEKAVEEYLKLAEATYSIFNYQKIEKNIVPEYLKYTQDYASKMFDNENQALDNNKAFRCAFIEASPYDILVDSGVKLISMIDKYADQTEYKESYKKFKKTIISYIPKMMINDEQKAKIMKSVNLNTF